MKKAITFTILVIVCNLFADDSIFKKNSVVIHCNVIDITSDQIRYYKKTNLQYPIFSIPKSSVNYIIFEGGDKIVITKKNINKPIPLPKHNLEKFEQLKKTAIAPQVQKIPKTKNAIVDGGKIDSIEIDAIAKDSLKVDTISVDSIVIDSMFANSEVTDTIEIDSIFVDSFRIETLKIDTIEVDTTEIANSMLDTFKVDSATTSRTVVKRESFKDIFKIKPYIYRKYATFFGFGSTNASFKNSSSNNSSSVSSL